MLAQLHDSQSALIVITSLRTDDLPADQLATLAVTADQSWLVQTPYIDLHPCPTAWAMCSRPCCWAI
jgi:pyridoxine kinase